MVPYMICDRLCTSLMLVVFVMQHVHGPDVLDPGTILDMGD